jgi:hypothetical protein
MLVENRRATALGAATADADRFAIEPKADSGSRIGR